MDRLSASVLGLSLTKGAVPEGIVVPERTNTEVLEALRMKRESMQLRHTFLLLRYLRDRDRLTCDYSSPLLASTLCAAGGTSGSLGDQPPHESYCRNYNHAMCIIQTVNITEIPFFCIVKYLSR